MSAISSCFDVLAVDLGGTKTLVTRATVTRGGGIPRVEFVAKQKFASKSYSGLEVILAEWQAQNNLPFSAVAAGVAGPTDGQAANITNLPWRVEAAKIRAAFNVPVILLNDLAAHAQGLEALRPEDSVTLQVGAEKPGNRALIAAGTGLGEALLVYDGSSGRHVISASEGGHVDFAPVTEDDAELWRFATAKFGRVSYERLVSGLDGFRNLFDFLVERRQRTPSLALVQAAAAGKDIGAAVLQGAENGDPLAAEILTWFVRLYGQAAGNLALKALASGGFFVGGGIAPRIVKALQQGEFMRAFTTKGRLSPVLLAMPVRVILDQDLGLKGAALRAAHLAAEC